MTITMSCWSQQVNIVANSVDIVVVMTSTDARREARASPGKMLARVHEQGKAKERLK